MNKKLRLYLCSIFASLLFSTAETSLSQTNNVGEEEIFNTFVFSVNGKDFYTNNAKYRTWYQAKTTCTAYNMTLASITSEEEYLALKNATGPRLRYDHWIGGRDSLKVTQFAWNGTEETLDPSYLELGFAFTAQSRSCVGYYASDNVSISTLVFGDCGANPSFTLCHQYQVNATALLKEKQKVVEKQVQTVSVPDTETPSKTDDNLEDELILVAVADGKGFYAGSGGLGMKWHIAGNYCQANGMELASITSKAQYEALKSAYNDQTFMGSYWTAGRDSWTLGQFVWDDSKEDLDASYLELSRTSFSKNDRSCVGFRAYESPESSALIYGACNVGCMALCERIL